MTNSTWIVHLEHNDDAATEDYGPFRSRKTAEAFAARVRSKLDQMPGAGPETAVAALPLHPPLLRNVKADGWTDNATWAEQGDPYQ